MEEFELPVIVNGKEELVSCRLVIYRYTHRVLTIINNGEVCFEKDDEGNYRAIMDGVLAGQTDFALVEAIANKLQQVFG